MLAGKDQHGMGQEGTLDVGPYRVIEVGKVDASDDGAECGSSRSNRECHESLSCVFCDTAAMGASQPGIQRDGYRLLARHASGQRLERALQSAQREAVRMHLLE